MVVRFHVPLLLLISLTLNFASTNVVAAADAKIRIVFFTPQDIEPPEGVSQRMKEVVDYGQAFYGKWLKHWGYEPQNVLPIERDKDGIPAIYYVRGDKTAASGAYDEVGYQGAVREQAIQQYKIPRAGSTFWIFVYGTKLKASRGVGGVGDSKGNGWALLVWHSVKGELPLDLPMCRLTADRINLKGYLHELGHTMNLAHFGPLDSMTPRHGMSLMGPNSRTYRRARRNREEKVHLNQAVAALIWKSPQMTGRYESQPRTPKIEVNDFNLRFDPAKKQLRLQGRLKSDVGAHSVVGINHPEVGPQDYWKKAFASRLSKDGKFDLAVGELSPSSGKLQVVFCFDNGFITGNGKGYGYKFAAVIPYVYQNGDYKIAADQR